MYITIIGSGNVATHMAAAFKNAGHNIVQVYSPNMHNASLLAYHVGAAAINNLDDIDTNAAIFVIAVKDDAIAMVAEALAKHQKIIVHTSGATGLNVIMEHTQQAGVIYPLQTFSKTREIDFTTVPLCLEAANDELYTDIAALASTISKNVYKVDSAGRKVLHLAAVFACNFPNYLYNVAQQLLDKHQLDFDILKPLILETAQKVQEQLPANVQTGPAARNDQMTMDLHLQMLNDTPRLKDIYTLLSQGIIKNNKGGHEDK